MQGYITDITSFEILLWLCYLHGGRDYRDYGHYSGERVSAILDCAIMMDYV
jgi:hypothetical protein